MGINILLYVLKNFTDIIKIIVPIVHETLSDRYVKQIT